MSNMSAANHAQGLVSSLSENSELLIDPRSSAFKDSMKRWSERHLKTPSAIIKTANESDVAKIVLHLRNRDLILVYELTFR